jgi:2-oxo-4-hydroxy-4-carboxy-5-ureidoimidazoline decarboxylase
MGTARVSTPAPAPPSGPASVLAAPAQPHAVLNALASEAAREALRSCCGAARWVDAMSALRPFVSSEALYAAADRIWRALDRADVLEAFAHHPRIGDRAGGDSARAATATSHAWSAEEQARAAATTATDTDSASALRTLNQQYAARCGSIFIICATGKSADQILAALRARLPNPPDVELAIAAGEQGAITRLRLEKLAR